MRIQPALLAALGFCLYSSPAWATGDGIEFIGYAVLIIIVSLSAGVCLPSDRFHHGFFSTTAGLIAGVATMLWLAGKGGAEHIRAPWAGFFMLAFLTSIIVAASYANSLMRGVPAGKFAHGAAAFLGVLVIITLSLAQTPWYTTGGYYRALWDAQDKADKDWFAQEKTKAEAGDLKAQEAVGIMYFKGTMVAPRDYAQALRFLQPVAASGNLTAMYALGKINEYYGWYEKDEASRLSYNDAAVQWYRKAAPLGEPNAQWALGNASFKGEITPQDYTEAYVWLSLALERQISDSAMFWRYEDWDHAKKNRDEALKHLGGPEIVEANRLINQVKSQKQ
ncbi:MAG: hypothetical protein ACAH83_09390 [Alphaproteobacteria bacterium]